MRLAAIGAGALLAETLLASSVTTQVTQNNPYALDRLFLTASNSVPFNEVLPFGSKAKVENYFGVNSPEAQLADDFFSGYTGSSATMLFDRFPPGGGRARIYGADLDMTLKQLQTINGQISITSQGYTFNAQVDLSNATSFADAASLIQSALRAAQPTVATTTGSSIAEESAQFTGSVQGGLMNVTAISSGSVVIGGIVTSPNGYRGHIVGLTSGTPGGVGVYNVWYAPAGPNHVIAPPGSTLSETYGILTVGTVTSGAIAIGQEVAGGGTVGHAEIQANISGSGNNSTWVVDVSQTVGMAALAFKAAPLNVSYQYVPGAGTTNSKSFWINCNANCPQLSSSITDVEGSAAKALGLTSAAGAYISTPGQRVSSASAWMDNIIQNETHAFSSFQTTLVPKDETPPEIRSALEAWAKANGYTYLKEWSANTPPIMNPNSTMNSITGTFGK
jgi:hypothetical protein